MFIRTLVWLTVMVLVAACGAIGPSQSASPTASAVPSLPSRSSPPSGEPGPTVAPTPPPTDLMTVTVLPAEEPPEARPAIPGERVSFLIMVDDRDPDDGEITFAATGDGVTIDSVPATAPAAGEVAELWVIIGPYEGPDMGTATVDLTVTHGGASPVDWVERRSIIVTPETDDRPEIAEQYFDFWVAWLAAEHPELGIDQAADWEAMYVSALWIVSKYAYWSDEWEMVVTWHEMVPPDDFTEVYLRRRDSEVQYSLAFRQDSWAADSPPRQIVPAEKLIR